MFSPLSLIYVFFLLMHFHYFSAIFLVFFVLFPFVSLCLLSFVLVASFFFIRFPFFLLVYVCVLPPRVFLVSLCITFLLFSFVSFFC